MQEMIYGIETVALTKRQEGQFEVVEMKRVHFSVFVMRFDGSETISTFDRGNTLVVQSEWGG